MLPRRGVIARSKSAFRIQMFRVRNERLCTLFSVLPRKAQEPCWQEELFDLAVSVALPGFFPLLQLPVAATCGVATISASQP